MFKRFLLPVVLFLPALWLSGASIVLAQNAGRDNSTATGDLDLPPSPLTFEEAMKIAIKNQPLIAAKQAAVDVSRTEIVTASQLPDPRLKLAIQDVPTSNFSLTEDSFTKRSVAVEQVVPREEKRRLRSERAGIEAKMGAIDVDELGLAVQRDTALAWLGLYGAEQNSRLLREARMLADRQREALRIAFATGKTGLSNLKRLDVELAQVEDRVAETRGETIRARAELERWLGLHAGRPLTQELPTLASPRELKYLQKGIQRKPQIAAVREKILLAENDLAQSRASKLPDWAIEVGYARRGPAFADLVSVQVSFDLPLFPKNRQDQTIYARQRTVDQRVQEHADHERMLQAELAAAYADWSQFTERAGIYERQVLRDARQRHDASLTEYSSGRGDLASVIEAQRAEVEVRLQLLALQVKAAKARVQLTYLAE